MTGKGSFVRPPGRDEIREHARSYGVRLAEHEVDHIEAYVAHHLRLYRRLDGFRARRRDRNRRFRDRDPGYRPDAAEDPLNAFVTRCRVDGADDGPLAGYEVGLKDNVAVAGVEMTNGSTLMAGFVPDRDATVVERLLDAGATITGKLSLHAFSHYGGPEAPVRNPHDPERGVGGSSSGPAAAVAAGEVDVALGTDQGGSIRTPAALTGCVGLKPTWGLVPYTGCVSSEDTLDHVGPIARTVTDCALVMDAVAGTDPLDPRQRGRDVETRDYAALVEDGAEDLTVGLLTEGFEMAEVTPAVRETVTSAVDRFAARTAGVTDVSVPWHADGHVLAKAISVEGMAMKYRHDGMTPFSKGFYDEQLSRELGRTMAGSADDLPLPLTAALVLGSHLGEAYHGRYYARAKNLAADLAAAYDEALDSVDVLALPTCGSVAPELPEPDSYEEATAAVFERLLANRSSSNRSQFDVTGHPAITVPCGTVDGLPVGLQLVGKRFRDDVVLRAARAFERHVGGWNPPA